MGGGCTPHDLVGLAIIHLYWHAMLCSSKYTKPCYNTPTTL